MPDLFDEPTFGMRCAKLLRERRASNGGKLEWDEVAAIIEEELTRSVHPTKRATAAKLDEVYMAMVRCCGWVYGDMTPPMQRAAGVALAQIRKVSPDLDRREMETRIARYRKKYPGAAVTPSAIYNHWGALAGGDSGAPKKPDAYTEPDGWRDKLRSIAGAKGWDAERVEEICVGSWLEAPLTVRQELI